MQHVSNPSSVLALTTNTYHQRLRRCHLSASGPGSLMYAPKTQLLTKLCQSKSHSHT